MTGKSQIKVAFVLLVNKLRTETWTHQHLSKKKRDEIGVFLNEQFLDTLALLGISTDALIGAQNYVLNIAESAIVPYSKEYWDRVLDILHS